MKRKILSWVRKVTPDIKRIFTVSLCMALLAVPILAEAPNSHIVAANRHAGKFVALTFDDGPHPVYTEKILKILADNNAKATFFVVGKNAESYPDLVTKEFEAGHEIGNHTYSHPNMKKIGVSEAIKEIEQTQEIVHDITGSYSVRRAAFFPTSLSRLSKKSPASRFCGHGVRIPEIGQSRRWIKSFTRCLTICATAILFYFTISTPRAVQRRRLCPLYFRSLSSVGIRLSRYPS